MINYGKEVRLAWLKYYIIELYNKHKYALIILAFFILLAFLTGIFTAIKLYNLNNDISFESYSFITLYNGEIYSFGMFVKRYLSMVLMIGLLALVSLNKYAGVLGGLLICYRAFLLTLNCSLSIILLGFGGMLNAILIVFPCNLIEIFIMSIFLILSVSLFVDKKICGKLSGVWYKLFIYSLLALLLINVLELILLIIFKPTTILII